MMNERVDSALDPTDADQIADMVYANRVRRDVLTKCDAELKAISEGERKRGDGPMDRAPDPTEEDLIQLDYDRKYVYLAAKAEAHFGLGDMGGTKLSTRR